MNSAKVVEAEPASDRGPVVLPLLTEGVRKARESSIAHARAQIAAFDYRRANSFWIRLPMTGTTSVDATSAGL